MYEALRPMILSFASLLQFDNASEGDDAPVTEFVLPDAEQLSDREQTTDEQLAELQAQAVAAFDAIHDAGNFTAETLAAMEDLATALQVIQTEIDTRETQAAEAQAAADALRAQVHGEQASAEGETAEGDEPGDGDDPEGGEGDEPAEGDEPDPEGEQAVEGEQAPAEAVTASAPAAPRRPQRVRVPVGAIAQRAPDAGVQPIAGSTVTLVAAADLAGIPTGSGFESVEAVGVAMHDRARRLNDGGEAPIASIYNPQPFVITKRMSPDEQEAMIQRAVDEGIDRIAEALAQGGAGLQALTAAGGWCAPNATLYDLFSIEGRTGLVDLPTIGIERGGIDFVQNGGPSLADVWGSTGVWLWTEQNDLDALNGSPTKPCVRIPCPTWTSERLEMHGICVTHGNLADEAYPEGTRRYIDLVMSVHEHTVNSRLLADMAAQSADVTIAEAGGTTASILSAIELQVLDYRDKFRMDLNAPLESVFPHWTIGLIRADIARRGGVQLYDVTDQQVLSWFALRGTRPQFVYDWQALQTGLGQSEIQTLALGAASAGTFTIEFEGQTTGNIAFNANAAAVQAALEALSNVAPGDIVVTGGALPAAVTLTFGGQYQNRSVDQITIPDGGAALTGETITIATTQQGGAGAAGDGFREAWPTTLDFMLYAAGTFVRGNGPKIDLGVTRDSTLNALNDHTAAWSEEAILLAKRGHESRLVSVTGVDTLGTAFAV